jgi:hypothetical protein
MSLEVVRMTVDQILDKLRLGEWQVPKFQREFVWVPEQVFGLLNSIFKSRPIGLVTLWAQPQGNPHTTCEPIALRDTQFRHFKTNPAVMKLILDGRQRLTVITMAFGGLRESDARRNYSGRWFLDLEADPEGEQFIVYRGPKQIEAEQLTTPAVCLAKALVPLEEYEKFKDYSGNVNNPDFYPKGLLPTPDVRERRRERIANFHERYLRFQIPIAELPHSVTLAEVCEIFDVLNTTGTKVSTFDLIHNLNFAVTKGGFDLRGRFESCQEEYGSLSMLCDSSRQEFFCQMVTGCYLSEPEPKSRKAVEGKLATPESGKEQKLAGDDLIRNIKGGDLLNTPTSFYESFSKNLPKIDSYCSTLFSPEVLGAKVYLKELAYPASVLHYISLRWAQEKPGPKGEQFTVSRLNQMFRAFFWINALSSRYDQGFLTKFSADLKSLRSLLSVTSSLDDDAWRAQCNKEFEDSFFTLQNRRQTKEEVTALLREGELRGATKQALALFMYGRIGIDILDGTTLDRFAEQQGDRVQLHHIYPKDWCKNNQAHHPILQNNDTVVNAFANLVPLTARSNNLWKTKSPSTAISEFGLSYATTPDRYEQAFIDVECFGILERSNPSPEEFWRKRSALLAEGMYRLQFV